MPQLAQEIGCCAGTALWRSGMLTRSDQARSSGNGKSSREVVVSVVDILRTQLNPPPSRCPCVPAKRPGIDHPPRLRLAPPR